MVGRWTKWNNFYGLQMNTCLLSTDKLTLIEDKFGYKGHSELISHTLHGT